MPSIIERVCLRLMRLPLPYAPPAQPVFTSQTRALCFFIFAASNSAYLLGCQTRNGPPKHGENVACGSVTPTSVPATFAVYPLTKWYIACAGVRRLIGGRTLNASQVKKMTFFGWPPIQGIFAFGMNSIG